MIIQRVVKGIGGIDRTEAERIRDEGIPSHWLLKQGNVVNPSLIPSQLTERNLDWHQNHYADPDPPPPGALFSDHTPFLSTTAGTVERSTLAQTNLIHAAWYVALQFATRGWSQDGYLFYCYLFVLGKKAVGHQGFAEELRELNIYTGFSPYQPEGEITAKILIPPSQIERVEYWSIDKYFDDLRNSRLPTPKDILLQGSASLRAEDYLNLRDLLD